MKIDHAQSTLPVAIIGAGPVGLAAASELILRKIPVVVFEAGEQVGAHISTWGHVRMFSPWRYNISRAARSLLEPLGWRAPAPDVMPTGREMIERYLAPLAAHPAIRDSLRLASRVIGVTRVGLDKVRTDGRGDRPFLLRVTAKGEVSDIRAQAVIDCSGTFSNPSTGGAHGIPARGERDFADAIAYSMPDILGASRSRYAGKRVGVVGSGHSAIGVLLDLVALRETAPGTDVVWLSRRSDLRLAYGGGDKDGLPARGELGTRLHEAVADGTIRAVHPFALDAIEAGRGGTLRLIGVAPDAPPIEVDALVVATGFRPDLAFLGEVRLDLDPALECPRVLAPLIDPNVHSCGSVRPHGAKELGQPEPGFYLAGMKSYGRAPTFLLATGHEQVRSIVAEIAGDHAAAARVELELPETGVCSTDFATSPVSSAGAGAGASGCCGGPPKTDVSACCVKDEVAKTAGEPGCGCGSKPASSVVREPAMATG